MCIRDRLLTKGQPEEARIVLASMNNETTLKDLQEEMALATESTNAAENIFIKKYRFPLMLAFFIAFFNQFSGINAFLYYAPRIFEAAGLGESTALLSSIGIGITNLLFTIVGIMLIDRLGRRQLMYYGSFGYIISLILVACAFIFEWEGIAVPIFLFLFIASHAIGQGAVILSLIHISEPTRPY